MKTEIIEDFWKLPVKRGNQNKPSRHFKTKPDKFRKGKDQWALVEDEGEWKRQRVKK